MTSIDKYMRETQNRDKFAHEIEARTQKLAPFLVKYLSRQRFGLFGQPPPLTVGDSSTYYIKPSKILNITTTFRTREIGMRKDKIGSKQPGPRDQGPV